MENICILDSAVCGNWCAVGLFIKGRGRSVQRNGGSAAAVTVCMAVYGGVEYSVCTDGHQRNTNFPCAGFAPKEAGTESFYHTAGAELLLESDFLQSASLRIGFCLAHRIVDYSIPDDSFLPQDRPRGSMAANSLSYLADLCRISELRCRVSEPIEKRPAHAGRFFTISD